jgi:hypothetical protein
MTVKELIERLQKENQELPVSITERGSIFSFELHTILVNDDPKKIETYGVVLVGGSL